jgi:uncharacterized protein (DUF302 family)
MKDRVASQITNMDQGIVTEQSSRPMEDVVRQLEELLAQKGVKLFAIIDHAREASNVGMAMPPTKLLIFGNPSAGTPIMRASPTSAIDLPLKILVAEDENGIARVSYNSPSYLQGRHGIPDELTMPLRALADLVRQVL